VVNIGDLPVSPPSYTTPALFAASVDPTRRAPPLAGSAALVDAVRSHMITPFNFFVSLCRSDSPAARRA
jgi:hypothetical protein